MSEERFYNQMREQLFDYSPEVPQSVYSGMRRKLWWSDFTSFKAFRFNMWYLLIMVGGASAAVIYSTKENTDSIATKAGTFESRSWEPTLANATAGGESAPTSCCASHEQTGTCGSEKRNRSRSNAADRMLTSEIVQGTPKGDVPVIENPPLEIPVAELPATEVPEIDKSTEMNPQPQTPVNSVKAPTKPLTVPQYYDNKEGNRKKK
jgi:hypothetical protein